MPTNEERRMAAAVAEALANARFPISLGHEQVPFDRVAEQIRQLAEWRPAAGFAFGAYQVLAGARPTPIDAETLEPTSDPLESLEAILEHWSGRDDGVGLPAGPLASGVLVALKAPTLGDLESWWVAHGTEEQPGRQFDDRSPATVTQWRDRGRFNLIYPQPPAGPSIRSVSTFGSFDFDQMNISRTAQRAEWLARGPVFASWLADATPPVKFRNYRIGGGVSLIAAGIIPYFVRRPDGTTLTGDGVPLGRPMPAWLVAKFGGSST